MNLKSRLTLPLVLVVSCLFAASGPAAEVLLSETLDLQAEGDLAYTFEAGDTFVVDQTFSPTSFKPTCSGDFTMKVVEGGSVASSTTLDFSAVTGALTLSGLGTADSRLPAPTVASNKTVNLESCWFSGLTLTTASLKGVTYNVSGTGALGALSCLESSSTNTATLNLSGTQEITSIASPYRSGGTYLTVKVAAAAEVTVTGEYDAGTSSLTIEGTMTCQRGFKTNRKSYQETHVYVNAGGTLAVTGDFKLGDGYNANAFLHVQGGTVTVSGTFIRNCSSQAKGTVGISSGLLRVGSLKDQNSGTGLPFGNGQSATTTNYLTGGTLEVLNGTWTSTAATFHTKGTTVKVGESTSMGIAWVLEADTPLVVPEGKSLTFANTITGEGGFILSENKGTVGLGTNRPTLKSVGGTIAVTPTTAEGIAGKVSLPVGEGVTSLEGVTIEVSAWSAYETTTSLGETAIEVTVANPKRTLAGNGTWSGTWENTESTPTSGSAEVVATADGTLTIDQAVSLDALFFDVGAGKTLTVALDTGASLAATQTVVRSGKVIVQGGTYGAVSLADAATLLFAQDGMFSTIAKGGTVGLTTEGSLTLNYSGSGTVTNSSKLLLRNGTFRKEGTGSVELKTYNVMDVADQSIEVAGGTLTYFEQGGLGGNLNGTTRTFKNLTVAPGCTFVEYAKWGVHFAVREALVGEGTISTDKGSQPGLRKFFISGEAKDFTGTIDFEKWTSLVFESTSSGAFGGSITLKQSGRSDVQLVVERAAGLSVGGSVTLGNGVGLDLSAGGGLSVGGAFTAEGTVPVTLSENPTDGLALVTLTGESATADEATVAKFSVPSGYYVAAEEKTYVLRAVTLPGVKPSEPEAGDESAYSTDAASALREAAGVAGLKTVDAVLLQTKGAAAATPTVTEVNNVLGCFEGVVEADVEAQTLTIRYEFGVADIGPDLDEAGAWNGNWYVVAKVEGPAAGAAAFAEGVIVSAYEVGEDGQIPDGAAPLATETVAAGTPVSAVTLKGITLTGLGTHGVRVRVRAEQQ